MLLTLFFGVEYPISLRLLCMHTKPFIVNALLTYPPPFSSQNPSFTSHIYSEHLEHQPSKNLKTICHLSIAFLHIFAFLTGKSHCSVVVKCLCGVEAAGHLLYRGVTCTTFYPVFYLWYVYKQSHPIIFYSECQLSQWVNLIYSYNSN